MDVSCILESDCCCLFVSLFLHFFFLSNFQSLKSLVELLSGIVSHRKLKLGTHGQWADVSCIPESAAAAYSSLYFSFFFLSNFQTSKFFAKFFSGTVSPRRLRLVTHVVNRWMYCLYQNQAAAAYSSFISLFFFLPNFQTLNFFVTQFSGTVRPRRLKLGTHVDNGHMYFVYQNQAAAAYLSLYS